MVDKYSLGFPLWYLQNRVCLLLIMIWGSDCIRSSWQILWHWFQVLSMNTILVNGNLDSTKPSSVLSQEVVWNWSRPLLFLPGKTKTAFSCNEMMIVTCLLWQEIKVSQYVCPVFRVVYSGSAHLRKQSESTQTWRRQRWEKSNCNLYFIIENLQTFSQN